MQLLVISVKVFKGCTSKSTVSPKELDNLGYTSVYNSVEGTKEYDFESVKK